MTQGRARLWLGTLARLFAFGALFSIFAILTATAWSVLPVTDEHLGSVVTMAVAATLAGVALMRGAEGRGITALGLGVSRMTLPHWGLGIAIGAAALLVAAAAMLVGGTLAWGPDDGRPTQWLAVVAGQLAFFAIAAFAEEILFRGYAFQVLARAAGPAVAAVLTSALFALAHRSNPSVDVFALVNIFLAGLLLAAAYLRTLSLWFATAVHLGWNWTMASVLDLPVSGITGFDTPLYDAVVEGPSWFSGAQFGPEGGVVGTLGFAFALATVLAWRAIRPDPQIALARPLFMKEEERDEG